MQARRLLSASKTYEKNVNKCELNLQNLSIQLQLIDDALSNGQV